MANDWREFVEKLLSQINIVNVVSRYVPLQKKGNRHWGCCPFHHEKEPSFTVNENEQFYYCFGCKESGNAISFIQKMESVERIDAIKILAQEAKMELPSFDYKQTDEADRRKRERLYALMRAAAKHYNENLSSPRAKHAIDYIKAREIPANLVTRFGFGMSLDGTEIITHLESLGYTKQEMKDAGLIEQRADSWYDVFYGRLMIPIINNMGEVVAFGGRLINPETHIPVKYRNSTNTPIFDKSKTLYAVNLLKRKKQRENVKFVIVAEGYMDVLALHKAGFDTAVASMGTALTYAQAKLIRNYSTNVYISYDGDNAGQTAMMRGLDILKSAGLNVKVVVLPEGLDPDDLIKSKGAEAYQKLLDEALTLPAFKLEVVKKRHDLSTPDGKSAYAIDAIKVIKALENPVEREEYLKIVQKNSGYSFDALRKQADITEVEQTKPLEAEKEPSTTPKRDSAQLFVMASVVHQKPFVNFADDLTVYLSLAVDKRIYETIKERNARGEKLPISMLYSIENSDEVKDLTEYEFATDDNEALARKYASSVGKIKMRYLEKEKMSLASDYEKTKDVTLLQRMTKIDKALRLLKNGENND